MTWVSRQISPLSEDMISEETLTRYKEPVSKWRGIQLTVCDGVGGGEVVAVVCFLKTINTWLTETNGGQEVRGARKASHPGQNDPRDYNWQSLHTSYLSIVNISFVTSYHWVTRLVSRPFPRPKCLDSSLETSFDTKMPNSAIHPVFKSFLLLTD